MTALIDLEISQGASFRRTFGLYDRSGAPIDLTGAAAELQIRRTIRSVQTLVQADTENGKLELDPTAGKIRLILSGSDTEVLTQNCVFSLMVTYSNADPREELRGVVRVNQRIVQ